MEKCQSIVLSSCGRYQNHIDLRLRNIMDGNGLCWHISNILRCMWMIIASQMTDVFRRKYRYLSTRLDLSMWQTWTTVLRINNYALVTILLVTCAILIIIDFRSATKRWLYFFCHCASVWCLWREQVPSRRKYTLRERIRSGKDM